MNGRHHVLRVVHDEALESVAHRPDARKFRRTSYCVAPARWRALAPDTLEQRVAMLLDAAIQRANWTLRDSDDPTGMALLGFDFAWLEPSELAAKPWTSAYFAWKIDAGGESWTILKPDAVAAEFDALLSGDATAEDEDDEDEDDDEEPAKAPLREMIRAYHQRRVGISPLLRALAEHDEWLAPAVLIAQGYGRALERVVIVGDGATLTPDGDGWGVVPLYCDVVAAERASSRGALVGACEAVRGAELFAGFDARWGVLAVNPGSERDECLVFEGEALALVQAWGRAVALEAALVSPSPAEDDGLVAHVAAFDGFFVLRHIETDELEVVTSRGRTDLLAFTAQDCVEAFLAEMEEHASAYRVERGSGRLLCGEAIDQGLDGIAFNRAAESPGPRCRIDLELAEEVAALG